MRKLWRWTRLQWLWRLWRWYNGWRLTSLYIYIQTHKKVHMSISEWGNREIKMFMFNRIGWIIWERHNLFKGEAYLMKMTIKREAWEANAS
jgi:hypothetical protein